MATINTATRALSNVVVEYTTRGARLRKTFPTVTRARAFYTAQFRAGAEPRIVTATRGIQTKEHTMTAKNTTAAPAKTPKVAKASKTAKVPVTEGKSKGPLTAKEITVLSLLAKSNKPLTRADLIAKTGIAKGWSALLGAASKGDVAADTLMGRSLVKAEKHDGERVTYLITAAGRKALEQASK